MFNFIRGIVEDIDDNILTVETGGIGYEIVVPSSCLSNFVKGKEAKVFTYLAVREDGISLYGFYSKIEKSMFLRLLTVSGIGPKAAVNILSGISLNDLATAVATADTVKLSTVKGIGKKTAERIILELKDKISAEININVPRGSTMPGITSVNDDVVLALVSLGMTKAEAMSAISKIDCTNLTTEQIIFKALKG